MPLRGSSKRPRNSTDLPGRGYPVSGSAPRERVDVDAVGDLDGVGAERLHLPPPRQFATPRCGR